MQERHCVRSANRLRRFEQEQRDARDRSQRLDCAECAEDALTRALRLAVVALGVGLVMAAGVARAQDDDEDDKTFEEKIIDGSWPASAAPTWKTGVSTTASARRWWCRPRSTCRRRRPRRKPRSRIRTGRRIRTSPAQGRHRGPQEGQARIRSEPGRPSLTPAELECRPDCCAAQAGQQRSGPARRFQHQSDAEPVAARLRRQVQQPVRRQQDRGGAVQGRAGHGNP